MSWTRLRIRSWKSWKRPPRSATAFLQSKSRITRADHTPGAPPPRGRASHERRAARWGRSAEADGLVGEAGATVGLSEAVLEPRAPLHEPLVEHRVSHLEETGDIGSVHVVPGRSEAVGRLDAGTVDALHDEVQ